MGEQDPNVQWATCGTQTCLVALSGTFRCHDCPVRREDGAFGPGIVGTTDGVRLWLEVDLDARAITSRDLIAAA